MTSLVIENFQSHELSVLNFVDGGMNVIIGPSDSGKSAVYRAIESLALNEQVDRRHGTKETSVSWKGVSRVRGAKVNEYRVDDLVFKAMRTGVPRQVQERLQLGEINFRPQHKSYFLLAESSGAVARSMNELADLGMIDHVTANLKSQLKYANSRLETLKTEILGKTGQLQGTDWAATADSALWHVEAHTQKARGVTEILGKIVPILEAVQSCDDQLQTLPQPDLTRLTELQEVLERADHIQFQWLVNTIEHDTEWLDSQTIPDVAAPAKLRDTLVNLTRAESRLTILLEDLSDQALAKCPPIEEHLRLLKASAIPPLHEGLSDLVEAIQALPQPLVLPDWKLDLAAIYKAYDEAALYQAKGDELEGIVENTQNLSARYVGMDFEYTLAIRNFNEAMGDQCPLCGEPR